MKEHGSLKDSLYDAILESIFNNEYRPHQIINEKELIERFGCSKTPVREALIALCTDNVLRNIPRCGYEVVRLTREDVEDMLRIRYLLEGGMLSQCYAGLTEAQLKKLEQLDDECSKFDNDIWRHWESNTQFHMYLVSAAHSYYAQELLSQTMGRLKRAYAQIFWERLDDVSLAQDTIQHRYMIQALRDGDLPQVLAMLKEDLGHFGDFSCTIPDYFGLNK